MHKSIIKFLSFTLCLLLLFAVADNAFAAGNGDGSGGGGGAAVPLWMDWCYPANGETNVSTTVVIQCKYSHNVAQATVGSRNVKLFSLTKKSDGTQVEIDVYTADPQLEFDKRQYIYIRPVQPLENNTVYVLLAKEGVQAKNGMVTAKDQSFEFTTCSAYGSFNDSQVESMVKADEAAALATPADGSGKSTSANGKNEDNEDNENSTSASATDDLTESADNSQKVEVTAEEHGENADGDNSYLLFVLIAVALLVVSILAKVLWLKRRG